MIKKGFEFDYTYTAKNQKTVTIKAFVAKIDKEKGITCVGYTVDNPDKETELICLNRSEFSEYNFQGSWEEMFNEISNIIESGSYKSCAIRREEEGRFPALGGMSSCAFK